MKKLSLFLLLAFMGSSALGQTFTVPDIVVPDNPNHRWKANLVNGNGGSPAFDVPDSWENGTDPFNVSNLYMNTRYDAVDKGTIVFDTGEARAYTGLVIGGNTELYVSSFLECNRNNNYDPATYVATGGTINQTGGTFHLDRGNLYIGHQSEGTYNISGGTYETFSTTTTKPANGILVGSGNGGQGYLNVSGTANINVSNSIVMGYNGAATGTLTVVGGTVTGGSNLQLGAATGSTGYANIGGGDVKFGTLQVGVNGDGNYNQTGGTMTAGNTVLGNAAGVLGSVTLTDGTMTVTGSLVVGGGTNESTAGGGSGVFTQTGGTLNVGTAAKPVAVSIGLGQDSSGEMTFTNGTIYSNYFNVGFGNSGTFTQYGGDINASNYFAIGNKGNGANTGTYNMYGGSITAKWLPLGHQRTGYFNMYDGTINLAGGGNGLVIGDTATARCEFVMEGGTINGSAGYLNIASSAGAIGTMTINNGQVDSQAVRVGSKGTGTLNINGGSITNTDASKYTIIADANGSVGEVNQTGGTFTSKSILYISNNAGANGTYNLSGGDASFNCMAVGNSGDGFFNMSGGTLTIDTAPGWYLLGFNGTGTGTAVQTGGDITAGWLTMAYNSTGESSHTISGGTLTLTHNASVASEISVIGRTGTGILNVDGGVVDFQLGKEANSLRLGTITGTDTDTGTGIVNITAGEVKVGGNLVANANSSVNFNSTSEGFGTMTVGGDVTEGMEVNVNPNDVILFDNYDPNGVTIMTVAGTGTPRVTCSGELYTAEFAANQLKVAVKDDYYKGSLSAMSGTLDWDASQVGWVSIEDMIGNDMFQLTFNVEGLTEETADDFLAAFKNAVLVDPETEEPVWSIDLSDDNTKLMVSEIAPSVLGKNIFAWDFTAAAYSNAMLGSMSSQQVPEPASILLLVFGLAGITYLRRRTVRR